MNASKLLMIVAAGLVIAGCGGSDTLPTGPGGNIGLPGGNNSGANDGGGATTAGLGNSGGGQFIGFAGEQPQDAQNIRDRLVVYFEFDSSEIRSEFNDMLASHARYLAADSSVSVRLEGHTDERGSREYNIGLGERRAQAVRQILQLQGATSAQLSTVSYGEERPAAFGSDDRSYELNRRVELVYR